MTVAEDWLLALVQKGGPSAEPARVLLRTQIVTARRTGHILLLGDEYSRRKVVNAARWGRVASLSARCVRCGWQAPLAWWVLAARQTREENAATLERTYTDRHPEDTAFLRPCPGDEYVRDVLAITSLPASRE